MWFLALAALATELKPSDWLDDQPETLTARFFDAGSGVWPACFGISDSVLRLLRPRQSRRPQRVGLAYYSVEGGFGSYLLKRTFTLA